jgi:hypothetical protein
MQPLNTLLSVSILWLAIPAMAQDKPIDWRKTAITDVDAAYKETAENHPGMMDKTNPMFPKLLSKARIEALKLAEKSSNAGGYIAALSRFNAVIDDGHAGAYANVPDTLSPPIRWPGFVAAWRGDAMYVYKSEAAGPAEGAKITACDGIPIRKLIARNVFNYRAGQKTLGNWWSEARRVFVDDGNPFIKLPQSCVFVSSGKPQTRRLNWTAIPDNYQLWKDGSANGDRLPIGVSEPAAGLYWIAMPDYQPDDAGIAAYKKMYANIDASRDKILKARAIVLDLRFNQGGSSTWSSTLASKLWGKELFEREVEYYQRNVEIWWRPTKGNERALFAYRTMFEKQDNAEIVAHIDKMIEGFSKAGKDGNNFWIEPNDHKPDMAKPARMMPGDPASLKTPVYVIVPGQCASACLDAIDYFKLFANTKLIGAPSSSDSTYMEVRDAPLPSGMGGAIIPMKIWRGRPRGNGVFYSPDIMMNDLDWSTANFQKRIEADLALSNK